MSRCYDFDECDCDCHRHPPGMVMHCMPCCYPCGKCGKNISTYAHSSHVENCEGTLDPNTPFLNLDDILDEYGNLKTSDE